LALNLVGRTTVRSTTTAIGRGPERLDAKTDPRTILGGPMGWIPVVKTKTKTKIVRYIDDDTFMLIQKLSK
jgi:hypothetical protein